MMILNFAEKSGGGDLDTVSSLPVKAHTRMRYDLKKSPTPSNVCHRKATESDEACDNPEDIKSTVMY